jgi:hypothetical protein
MGTKLTAVNTFHSEIIAPTPGEFVRAGGGTGTSEDVPGTGNNPDGRITYTGLVDFVRIRHLGGVSTTFSVSITGNDITVQLAANGLGIITTQAATVVAAVLAAAPTLITAVARGTGLGMAGVTDWIDLSYGAAGSVRPPFQTLWDCVNYLNGNLSNNTNLVLSGQPLHPEILIQECGDTSILVEGVPAYFNRTISGMVVTPVYVPEAPATYVDKTFLDVGTDFAPSTWYYVYSKTDGTIHIKTATPNSHTHAYVTPSQDTYKYMFCFFTTTDTPGKIMAFTKCGREYRLFESRRLFNGVTLNTTATEYDLQDLTLGGLPTTATQALLRMEFSNSGGSSEQVTFNGKFPVPGTTTNNLVVLAGQRIGVTTAVAVENQQAGFPNDFWIQVLTQGGTISMYLYVEGWIE